MLFNVKGHRRRLAVRCTELLCISMNAGNSLRLWSTGVFAPSAGKCLRLSQTPQNSTLEAASASVRKRSPTYTHFSGTTPASATAFEKISGSGLEAPISLDITTTEKKCSIPTSANLFRCCVGPPLVMIPSGNPCSCFRNPSHRETSTNSLDTAGDRTQRPGPQLGRSYPDLRTTRAYALCVALVRLFHH